MAGLDIVVGLNVNDSSPQGRIFQVEYAQEAVKQGSVVVGLVSKTHAVLVALKVPSHPFSHPVSSYWLTSRADPSIIIISETPRNYRLIRKSHWDR